ncbi:MAG: sigma-70 family RNA polymerase sigma factor [Acidimicrobiales bacterium]|nr:sigma-70 family RNA polymerase sigma factor [Acidimicrobiales bacterium]
MDATGFERLRPKLEGIAYRMTGSVADAQDVAQDAWIRWSSADRSDVADPEGYLVRVTTRLSLDRLKAASRRRETYVGPYLPEPVVSQVGDVPDGATSPEEQAVLADSLTFSFLVMLDELSPVERAVLLLHDVFGYSFDEVAAAVERSTEATRQIASRTRRRIAAARPAWGSDVDGVSGSRESADPVAAGRVEALEIPPATLVNLAVALGSGDLEALMDVLAPDVVTLTDGGPLQRAARRPVVGRDRVARLLVWLNQRALDLGLVSQVVQVNGRTGMAMHLPDGTPFLALTGDADDSGRIERIYMQLNPDKLAGVPPA